MLANFLRCKPSCRRELLLLQEDSASQQEELLCSLALLQAAHKCEEDLRRQVGEFAGGWGGWGGGGLHSSCRALP